MTLIKKMRAFVAQQSRQRRLYAEMLAMSESEMCDLNLSVAKIAELSRQDARSA